LPARRVVAPGGEAPAELAEAFDEFTVEYAVGAEFFPVKVARQDSGVVFGNGQRLDEEASAVVGSS